MSMLRFTLLADGSSDRVLVPILLWMLVQHHGCYAWIGQTANLQALPRPPQGLPDRIGAATEYFPADVLFVHRDAERESPDRRREEVDQALRFLSPSERPRSVPVVPVRMTEAWLLISETAIRHAAGNPNGRVPLTLPPRNRLESLPDPKAILETQLVTASELQGRRKKKFQFATHRARVAELIDDWSYLLELPSARRLFDEIGKLSF
jgi:hypothetical protein